MNISHIQSVANLYGASQAYASRGAGKAASVQKPDEVEISQEGQSFHDMLEELRKTDEVRPEKVSQYQTQLAEGTYAVDSQAVAQKMLDLRF